MDSRFDRFTHSWAFVGELSDVPFPIMLVTDERVWISGDYTFIHEDGVNLVGDGLTTGFDEDGLCVLSVAAERCRFMTDEEANNLIELIDIDAKMLAWARG
jgi:hypothetical protein